MEKVVISLSGGMDSTTLLAYFKNKNYQIKCINFQYGSKHNLKELESISNIIKYYNISYSIIDLNSIFTNIQSALLISGDCIPEGHYEASNMSQTVVPGRNAIMTTISAAYAESNDFNYVMLGQHKGDHEIYLDCRKEFVESINNTIQLSTGGKVSILSPFIEKSKAEICKIGLDLKVPYELTTTCYNGRKFACGKCASCVERIESFLINKSIDPIQYETSIDWKMDAKEFIKQIKSQ